MVRELEFRIGYLELEVFVVSPNGEIYTQFDM